MAHHVETNGLKTTMSTYKFIRKFIYSDFFEQFLMTIGILCGIASAVLIPIIVNLSCQQMDAFLQFGLTSANIIICQNQSINNCSNEWTTTELNDSIRYATLEIRNHKIVLSLVVIGFIEFTLYYIMVVSLNMSKERQVHRIRSQLFQAILRQDISWFDTIEGEELPNWTIQNISKLEAALGEKAGAAVYLTAAYVSNVINSLIFGWQLTLILLAVCSILFLLFVVLRHVEKKMMKGKHNTNVTATKISLEAITEIRTVQAFDGQSIEINRFDKELKMTMKAGITSGLLMAATSAVYWFMQHISNGVAIWGGTKLMREGHRNFLNVEYNAFTILTVLFCTRTAFVYLEKSLPYFKTLQQAKVAASVIFNIINRKPGIDSNSNDGLVPDKIAASVKLDSVHFSYPTRPEIKVLNDFSLDLREGETVALVGESGSGKTTVIQLLLRFYNPLKGTISLGGHDVRELNIEWLRTNIGVVNQESLLFSTTIAENIKYGLNDATQEDTERAATAANAHDFITNLPNKYDTLVGEGGTQLSGGQKQRIAIARALVRNPKLLLLDEATSALDAVTEARFLELLLKAKKDQTVLMVAHRLSTIANADRIAVMSNGRIVELGTHDELITLGGLYCNMYNKQQESSSSCLSSVGTTLDEEHYQDRLPQHGSVYEHIQNNEAKTDVGGEIKKPSSLRRLLSLCHQERYLLVLGYFGACGMGISMPMYALLLGYTMETFASDDVELIMKKCTFYSLMFVVLAVGTAICSILQIFPLTYSGEVLARRIRRTTFTTILYQDMSFFDNPKNSIGLLSNRLTSDAFNIQQAVGSTMGAALQPLAALVFGFIIVLALSWKTGLMLLCVVVLMLIFMFIQYKMGIKWSTTESKITDDANKIVVEATSNIRTVVALHAQNAFHQLHLAKLSKPQSKVLSTIHIMGVTTAFGLSGLTLIRAICYKVLGILVLKGEIGGPEAVTLMSIVWHSSVVIGQTLVFIPLITKGLVSATRISNILERQSKVTEIQNDGIRPARVDPCPPCLKFTAVSFKYPSRPLAPVLQDINLKIEPGQALAMVGTTGCGKTTCINLLQRFYNSSSGSLTFNDMDISALNVRWLRSQMALVPQEPVLFNRSVAENIAYGDNTRDVPMDDIVNAATKANIHHFIVTLPQGYQTSVGAKGIKLSGGQKQRIAIARALVRDPKILLLDEPTSAMDVENEKVIQEALDGAQKGRTCIIMAHRLTTIRNADQIAVIHRGTVVEKGTHEELMSLKGHYFRFNQTQHIQLKQH